MPNLPSQLGLGVTGYFASNTVNQADLDLVKNILATTGEIIHLSEEDIDKITESLEVALPMFFTLCTV